MKRIPKSFDLDITTEDIAKGKTMRSDACPVAIALQRKFEGRLFSVGPFHVYVGGRHPRFLRADGLYEFVRDFDTPWNGPVAPTTLHFVG